MTMQSRLATFVCGSVMLAVMIGAAGCSCIRGPWIVGTWKTNDLGVDMQFEFKKNGSFILCLNDDEDLTKRGSWRIDGKKLVLTNDDDEDMKFLISDKSSKSFTATLLGTGVTVEFTRK